MPVVYLENRAPKAGLSTRFFMLSNTVELSRRFKTHSPIRMRHYGRQKARSLHDLGMLHFEQGQYNEAEPLLRDALAICQKLLQPKNPDIARALHSLARLCTNRRKYDEAEPFYERALAIWKEAPWPDHPDMATCLEN